MKFTWKIELDSGKIVEHDLTEREIALLDYGIIDFTEVVKQIAQEMKEEDAL